MSRAETSKPPVAGCTCYLETTISALHDDGQEGVWDVVDCEGATIASCHTPKLAWLVAVALNAYEDKDTLMVCVIHRGTGKYGEGTA